MKPNRNILLLAAAIAAALAGSAAQAMTDPRAPRAIYEIFPRSFQDSDGDGIGDLAGIISRLDDLNDGKADSPRSLGVDAIWLTPVFASPSYHGYDTVDYKSLQPEYGDLGTMKKLLTEAHRRGIRVFLDMAVNHTSIQHPWFQSSATGEGSPERALYLWSGEPLDWEDLGVGGPPKTHWHLLGDQYYFGTFGRGPDADLNWRNPQVLARVEDIFRFWAALGVDGFRLDAAKFLVKGPDGQQNQPETHALWKQIVRATREIDPRAYFVGEVWDSAANIAPYYGTGDELDSCFDFPVAAAIRSSLQSREGTDLAAALRERAGTQPTTDFASPILGNHDMTRIASSIGDTGGGSRLKLAALAQLALPGTPTIYYGEEIGMPNSNLPSEAGDLGKRTPMTWDASPGGGFTSTPSKSWIPPSTTDPSITVLAQKSDPGSLWNAYRGLLALRRRVPELASGTMSAIQEPAAGVVAYALSFPGPGAGTPPVRQVVVVLNFALAAAPPFQVSLPPAATVPRGASALYGSASAAVTGSPASGLGVSALGGSTGAVFLVQ